MSKKVSIVGCGAWASGLAFVLSDNGYDVLLLGYEQEVVDEINNFHTNKRLFDLTYSDKIKATLSYQEILDHSLDILLCVTSDFLVNYLDNLSKYLKNDQKINFINCIKGFIGQENLTVSQAINLHIKKENINSIVSLLGPSFAIEVVKKDLTTIVAVSENINDAKYVQEMFSNDYFRVYTSTDLTGSQIASSYKNAIAIASGILEGLGYGNNARAGLITRGLNEIINFGIYFGAKKETFLGLTGIGDLLLTCSSKKSRNTQFGIKIAQVNNIDEVIKENTLTVEGLRTIKVIYEVSKSNNLETPIIDALYNVIYLKFDIQSEIKKLMLRPLKEE